MRVISSSDDDSICPYSGTDEVIHIRKALVFRERISVASLLETIRIGVHDCAYLGLVRVSLHILEVFPGPVPYSNRANVDHPYSKGLCLHSCFEEGPQGRAVFYARSLDNAAVLDEVKHRKACDIVQSRC